MPPSEDEDHARSEREVRQAFGILGSSDVVVTRTRVPARSRTSDGALAYGRTYVRTYGPTSEANAGRELRVATSSDALCVGTSVGDRLAAGGGEGGDLDVPQNSHLGTRTPQLAPRNPLFASHHLDEARPTMQTQTQTQTQA